MNERRGLARRFARWAVRRFYGRIEVVDAERIPQDGPVLLCANHANSLVDSVIIGIAARRPVRFMAKAPLFDLPVLGKLMRGLGMVPAFRGIDDKKQVRRNLESLDTGAGVLVEGHAMGIFPEGRSTDALHLEKVRSGAARMALQAVERGTEGVRIAPLGIAYERKERFRSAVLVRVAEPLDADAALAAADGNVARARRALTQQLGEQLRSVVIHLENPDWQPWLDDLEVLAPPAPGVPGGRMGALWQRKRIADAINWFWSRDRPRAENLAADIAAYRNAVHAAGLRLDSDVLRRSRVAVLGILAVKLLGLAVLLLPAAFGTAHFLLPYLLVRGIDRWMKEPGRMAVATHKLIFGIPIYALWHAAAIAVIWRAFDLRVALAWGLLAPFVGALALAYWREGRRGARLALHELIAITRSASIARLHALREQLRRRLEQMAAELEDDSVYQNSDRLT